MRIEGQRSFAAPPEAVFAALTDPHLAAHAIPGLHEFQVDSPDCWHGTVHLPVGPRVRFTFRVVERREPSHARLAADGKTFGGAVRVETTFDLEPTVAGGTLMRYTAAATLSGLLGRLGSGALKPIAELQIGGVMKAVEKHIAGRRP